MALGRFGQQGGHLATGSGGSGTRVIELVGDSVEIVALALLRQVAQLEQRDSPGGEEFDRKWLLDAYAECLASARGERKVMEIPKAKGDFARAAASRGASPARKGR